MLAVGNLSDHGPSTALSILGVGLLGGSIGLAVKSKLSGCTVVGYGHRAETLEQGDRRWGHGRAAASPAAAVANADLVILCTPVGLLGTMLGSKIGPGLGDRGRW